MSFPKLSFLKKTLSFPNFLFSENRSRGAIFTAISTFPFLIFSSETLAQATFGTRENSAGTAAQNSPQTQSQSNVGNVSGGDYKSSTISEQSNKIFDVETDMIDPGEGVLKWKGKVFQLENIKILRERFERYLSTPPPAGKRKDYVKILHKIEKLLTQQEIPEATLNKKMIEATSLLLEAAEFEADEKQSLILANQVYKACRQHAEEKEILEWQKALSSEKKRLETKFSGNEAFRRRQEKELSSTKKDGSKTVTKTTQAPSATQTFITEKLAENKASLAQTKTDLESARTKATLEFQSTMATFLANRHYRHALLASAFYRILFKSSRHSLEVAKSEFLDEVNLSKFVPSIETFDAIAREMQQETRKSVKSADLLWDSGQKYHAMRQIFSAFLSGEHELDVQYYPLERKAEIFTLWLEILELARQSENRDLGEIEIALNHIQNVAPDFPSAEISGKVEAAKRASEMSILTARQVALMAGMAGTPEAIESAMTKIREHLETAAEFWPQNPRILEFMEEILKKSDTLSQLAPEFDRLVAQNKKREIFNRRAEFTPALMQDAGRRKRLEEIVSHVAKIETALAQINMLIALHDDYIAWYLLLAAEKIDPEDDAIIKKKSEISPLVASYSRLLMKAQQSESEGKFPEALNKYLAAQDLNPTSEICASAISRISKRILRQISPADSAFENPNSA